MTLDGGTALEWFGAKSAPQTTRRMQEDDVGLDGSITETPRATHRYAAEHASTRITLIGDSVVQFLSFAVSRTALDQVQRTFCEDGQGSDGILQSFASGALVPADLAAQAYTVSGGVAADTFAGEWLPMACLRAAPAYATADSSGGPSNWVRLRLVPDGTDFRLVLAFDTWLADASQNNVSADVSPTLDDVSDGANFTFAGELEHLEYFIGEPWVDDWITAPATPGSAPAAARSLTRLAHYMTLVAALKQAGKLPDVSIVGTASGRLDPATPVRLVDLVIAFTHDSCNTHLIDVSRFDDGDANGVVPLGFRDLDRPWITHRGRMPNALAFSRPQFGNETLSRTSGRTDAFAWPSLARVGHHAHDLCRRQPADAPLSGVRNVMGSLRDTRSNDSVWRVAGDGSSAHARLPFVSGSLLSLYTETGERVAVGAGRTRATRARFSASALLSLAVHEIVVQAIAAANQADLTRRNDAHTPARLHAILVALPSGLQHDERDMAQQRIRDGVALAFDALRWPQAMQPDIVFATAREQALQYAYLHNEIAHRLGGRANAYLRLLAGPMRPSGTTVNVATLDVSASGLGLNISTISAGNEAHLALTRRIEDTAGIGLDDLAATIGRLIVVPALARHLEKARLPKATAFLQRVLQSNSATNGNDALADRLVRDTILPAAIALLTLHRTSALAGDTLPVDTTLGALLGTHVDHVGLLRIQDLAVADGANATSLIDTPVVTSAADVRAIVIDVLGPAVRAACRTIRRNRCSLLLLAGHAAVVGLLRDIALGEASVQPDRIVDLSTYRCGAWAGPSQDLGALQASGSLLAMRHAAAPDPRPLPQMIAFEGGSPSGRTTIFSTESLANVGDPRANGGSGERTHTFTFHGHPMDIGVSQLDATQWPLRPLARVEIAEPDALQRTALPLTVTLAFKGTGPVSVDAFEIRTVRDARGRHLPPNVLDLKAATARRLAVVDADDAPAVRARRGGSA